MTAIKPDKTLDLVSTAYGAAIEPERFDELLAVWDAWCDDHLDGSGEAFEILDPKFGEALSASAALDAAAPKKTALDAAQAPTILLDGEEGVVAVNAAAASLVEAGQLDIAHLIASRSRADMEFGDRPLGAFRCQGAPGGRGYLALESRASDPIRAQHPHAERALMLSLIDWDDAFADDLRARFNLSEAELRVAKGLLEGRTAQEIAGEADRSLATIRSHIKALLQKTGARRQMELVQLLTLIRQTAGERASSGEAPDASDFETKELTGPGGTLEVVQYGRGRALIYFTTSSLPEEIAPVRAAFAKAGFRVIAPARPGFRGDARQDGDANAALLDDWLDALYADAGAGAIIAGHREGGILAADAAARIIAAGGEIGGLALISTGAPTVEFSDFETAPETIKRSFFAARYAQTALSLGYHTAARVFRSGRFGEDKIVKYFFQDSPTDAGKMDDPALRGTIRDNIAYCFRDPSQIARDIAYWGSDWSDCLHAVRIAAPVRFFHGEDHTFLPARGVASLAETLDGVASLVFEGSAQLALYEHVDEIATETAQMGDLHSAERAAPAEEATRRAQGGSTA
ncbi:MAG: LuxR C-terminal-related transcriptional regulator [Pseudomonadota bacterium]